MKGERRGTDHGWNAELLIGLVLTQCLTSGELAVRLRYDCFLKGSCLKPSVKQFRSLEDDGG